MQPYLVSPPGRRSNSDMAGLWQWVEVQEGYEQSFAIITTAANAAVAPIHDRMPAILAKATAWRFG